MLSSQTKKLKLAKVMMHCTYSKLNKIGIPGTVDNILSSTPNPGENSDGSSYDNSLLHLLKLQTTGIIGGLLSPPFVVRMCPPLTVKNFSDYQPLLALGSSNGSIQVSRELFISKWYKNELPNCFALFQVPLFHIINHHFCLADFRRCNWTNSTRIRNTHLPSPGFRMDKPQLNFILRIPNSFW